MNLSLNYCIIVSTLLVLVFNLALTDSAAFMNDESMIKSAESDESSVNKNDVAKSIRQKFIAQPFRRQHLKFGVLGKRYSYGYLGRRSDVPHIENDVEDWLNEMRERRGARPQYGILG